jgi:hypothetical protein
MWPREPRIIPTSTLPSSSVAAGAARIPLPKCWVVLTNIAPTPVCQGCPSTNTSASVDRPFLQWLDGVYGGNGKRQWTPERNAIGHTHGRASSEHAWEPMVPARANFCRNRAPCNSRNPITLTLTQQNPWLRPRTVQQAPQRTYVVSSLRVAEYRGSERKMVCQQLKICTGDGMTCDRDTHWHGMTCDRDTHWRRDDV